MHHWYTFYKILNTSSFRHFSWSLLAVWYQNWESWSLEWDVNFEIFVLQIHDNNLVAHGAHGLNKNPTLWRHIPEYESNLREMNFCFWLFQHGNYWTALKFIDQHPWLEITNSLIMATTHQISRRHNLWTSVVHLNWWIPAVMWIFSHQYYIKSNCT